MIYYPHYTPSKERLRSILLFSNQISLIVPEIDQQGVEKRGHVSELLDIDSNLISFKDPAGRYTNWINEPGVLNATENLVADLVQKTRSQENLIPIRHDNQGWVSPGQDKELMLRWTRNRWKFIAAEKFPDALNDLIFKDGIALRVGTFRNPRTNKVVEHNATLCHPHFANMVLSRMAREASFVESVPSITFSDLNYGDHLFDGEQPARANYFQLLQSTMNLFVPDNIGGVKAQDYIDYRDEFIGVRGEVRRYLEDVSRDENLDVKLINQDLLIDRLKSAQDRMSQELTTASKQIGRDRFKKGASIVFNCGATVAVALLSRNYDTIAATGLLTALGCVVSSTSNRVSTLKDRPNGTLKSIAMSKARLERRTFRLPRYWS